MERHFNYLRAVKKDFATIKDASVPGLERIVKLEDIYVPLKLKEIYREAASTLEKERVIDVDAVVKNYHHLVILGEPGAGKTTLLKYLALKCCEDETDYIPVPITLREFSTGGTDLRRSIDTVFKTYGFSKGRRFVEKNLKSGRYILLLDGFDELAHRGSQGRTAKEIVEFIETYPAGKVVVTSRTGGYQDDLPGFTRLEVMGMDNPRIKQFIDKRFEPSGGGKANAMLRMVMDDYRMEPLVKNPLMLSLIASTYDAEREEPLKSAELFRAVLDAMLGEWDSHKGVKNRFSPEVKKLVLRKLAFHNHCRIRRTITEKDILEEISRYISRTDLAEGGGSGYKDLLEEICRRSGILRKLLLDTYDFYHFSFQEYFTGLELSEEPGTIGTLIPRLSESWWEGPILFCAGIRADASLFVRRIQDEFSEDIFNTKLMLTGKCVAESRSIDPLQKDEIVRELWQLYNTGEYQLLRESAMVVLSRIKPRRIINELLNQLTEPVLSSQRRAAELLGLMGSDDVIPALIMILVKEKESKIRGHAAVALGRIGSPEAVRPLFHVLEGDEEGEVRTSAAEALGLIGEKLAGVDRRDQRITEVFSALIKALTIDKDERVRGGAAEALGKIGTTGVLPQLIHMFDMERKSSVRWRIALALGKLGGMDKDVREVLIRTLHMDRSREVRESAAEALGFIGRAECIPALTRALTSDEDADVRGSAAYALGLMQSKEALPALIQALITDSNGEVRGRAAYALGRLGKLEAIPYLTAVLNTHTDSLIRGNATFALGHIGGEHALPFLVQALSFDRDPYVRYRAAEVLGSIGNTLTIQPLKIALNDEGSYYGWKVKDKAYEALEKISKRFHMRVGVI
jgi:HEAT repeat protein/ABC-type Fe3+/spermidine/putrescine transport system ATPase subunit